MNGKYCFNFVIQMWASKLMEYAGGRCNVHTRLRFSENLGKFIVFNLLQNNVSTLVYKNAKNLI